MIAHDFTLTLTEEAARKMNREEYKLATSYLRYVRRIMERRIDQQKMDKAVTDMLLYGMGDFSNVLKDE